VLGLFDVSETTVKRDRKAGRLPAVRQEGGRRAWLYRAGDLDELYEAQDIRAPLPNVFEGTDGPTEEAEPDKPDPETVARIVELELRAEWHAQEFARVKAERDQARNDVEHERGELARSQADIVQGRLERGRLEAQAETAQTIADERQARIEALDAHAQELLERADNTADELRDALNNVTRRYRRKLRQRDTALTPRWGKVPDDKADIVLDPPKVET